jgi:membrane protease YdiL (CAAX protease family)
MVRRILLFPLTRIVTGFAIVASAGVISAVLKLSPGVASIVVAGASFGAYALVGVAIERRTLAELGITPRALPRDLAIGAAIGAALFSSVVALLALTGCFHVDGVEGGAWVAAKALAFIAAGAFAEEVMFRALLFRIVEESLGSWVALAISAAFFGAAHIANPHATAVAAIAIAVEAGLLLGGVYMLSRSIWTATGLHLAWNFCEGPLYGTAVSGTTGFGRVLVSTTTGPSIWTGGDFGPEAGLAAVILCLAVAAPTIALATRRGRAFAFRDQRAMKRVAKRSREAFAGQSSEAT